MMSKAPNASGLSGNLDAARHGRIDLAGPDRAEGLADGHGAGGAGIRGREDRAPNVERDPEVGRRRPAEDRQGEVRRHGADAAFEIALVLLLGIGDPAEGTAEVDADCLRVRRAVAAGDEARVRERHLSRHEAELAEPVELAGRLGRHEIDRVEVIDLCCDLGAERRGVEAVDPADG